jgi:hypothetical protein
MAGVEEKQSSDGDRQHEKGKKSAYMGKEEVQERI